MQPGIKANWIQWGEWIIHRDSWMFEMLRESCAKILSGPSVIAFWLIPYANLLQLGISNRDQCVPLRFGCEQFPTSPTHEFSRHTRCHVSPESTHLTTAVVSVRSISASTRGGRSGQPIAAIYFKSLNHSSSVNYTSLAYYRYRDYDHRKMILA